MEEVQFVGEINKIIREEFIKIHKNVYKIKMTKKQVMMTKTKNEHLKQRTKVISIV